VTDQGGTVSLEHLWGLRDLSYEIDKEKRAYYALVEFRATPAALAEMERNLKLMDPVMRFLSVRQDENAPPARLRMDDSPSDERRADHDDDSDGRRRHRDDDASEGLDDMANEDSAPSEGGA
jgi:small subunit ribosomal protein S6